MRTKLMHQCFVIACGLLIGCSERPLPTASPTAAPAHVSEGQTQVRVTGIQKMNFPNGDSALVLNYETDIPISDKEPLRKEVDAIWRDFQKEVEKAGVNTGVIRATHKETSGFISKSKGYGFLFTKDDAGNWRLTDDPAK